MGSFHVSLPAYRRSKSSCFQPVSAVSFGFRHALPRQSPKYLVLTKIQTHKNGMCLPLASPTNTILLPPPRKKTRGRLARKNFSPGAHPAAETPFYIAAASVSARGDAQCVWAHESSISSSYQRKHGSARSHIFTSVKTRIVKLVKLETNQKEKQSIAKLTRRPQFSAKHAHAT